MHTSRWLLGAGLLVMAVFAPLVSGGAFALAVLGLLGLVLIAPERLALGLSILTLALAVALLAIGGRADRAGADLASPNAEPVRRALAGSAEALWQELEGHATAAATNLPANTAGPGILLDAFRRLGDVSAERGRVTLLLVETDGEALAWAGEGLLHEPRSRSLATDGRQFEAGFGAVSLFVVRTVEWGGQSLRIVAGRSFPNDRWPFPSPVGAPAAIHWSLVEAGELVPPGAVRIAQGDAGPAFSVITRPLPEVFGAPEPKSRGAVAAWIVLAAMLVGLAGAVGRRPSPGDHRVDPSVAILLGGAALAAVALAAGADPSLVGSFVGATGVLLLGLRAGHPEGQESWRPVPLALLGAGVALAALGTARGLGALAPQLDLGASLLTGADGVVLRGTLVVLVGGGLLLARRTAVRAGRARDFWFWLAAAAALAAGVAADFRGVNAALVIAAGVAAARALPGRRLSAASGLGLATVAALIAAASWEGAFRGRLEQRIEHELLPLLGRSQPAARQQAEQAMTRFFAEFDLSQLSPRDPATTEPQDLAFSLWRRSPLIRANSTSALEVLPFDGRGSRFTFGYDPWPPTTGEEGETRAADNPLLDGSSEGLVAGEETLRFAGAPWAVARFWIVPRPGFSLDLPLRFEAAEIGLLRGRPGATLHPAGLPDTVQYALYGRDGQVVSSPWHEPPPLSPGLVAGGHERVATPLGAARAWSYPDGSRVTVLYLPLLSLARGLERVGTHAAGSLASLGVVSLVALLLALPRRAVRGFLAQATRSYSKRLIVVFTGLLLLPLLLLNLVILKTSENRLLRAQRVAGENALAAAQRIMADTIEDAGTGISIAAVIDDSILRWLAEAVGQDINLYWGSSQYASSKPELFATGLLPRRIPGEIFAGLSLLGTEGGVRSARAGDTTYLELYAPLRIPGVDLSEQGRLVLSMPLLAQQTEVRAELAASQRQTLLVSAALFGLIVAIGTSFARRFSGPLEDLVTGTRRIAAGATSLGLPPPSELELAALARAIDDMAGKIADSREQLVREKGVVLRMVENITSGVVSLDQERRVLMHNRVAEELLGTEVGAVIDDSLARTERLAPVREFLAGVASTPQRSTLRLPGPDGSGEREWSLVWVPVPGTGEPAALLVVEDATEILRGQRLTAWAEMARIIAHEIKNPLTPIRLSTEHLRQVYESDKEGFDRVFERCTANILREVEELRQIAMEFSTYSSIPRIDLQPADLAATLGTLAEGYRTSGERAVEVTFYASERPLEARFDARLLGRAVRNLIENSLRVSPPGGRVSVRLEPEQGAATIVVLDEGPGVAPELLPRIFDPYFSTHDTGTGLGLPIVRRIAEEHGGTVLARNRSGGGLEVTIRIPR